MSLRVNASERLLAAIVGWAFTVSLRTRRHLVSRWRAVETTILEMRDEDGRACPICVRRAPAPDDPR